ncbi:hypothetical protein [Hyphomonas sp.]|uniref:hypothetical protein n=1 Tax=Hyphomonas sp. TaxID=87 RepID=UPI0039193278
MQVRPGHTRQGRRPQSAAAWISTGESWGIGGGVRLSERWNVALHYEHVSSGDVCIKGALGLENVGI